MSTASWPSKVVPAQLSFLAIYNPTLGPTEETFADQLVFHYSRASHGADAKGKGKGKGPAAAAGAIVAAKQTARGGRSHVSPEDAAREEENERLRQIGLAQGLVEFARSFADGAPVDAVETEKSRIILHELEKGWWILASIDLTRLPAIAPPAPEPVKPGVPKTAPKPTTEYSSREVSPPALLLQQLLQAHCLFGLHHGPSLSHLFVHTSREAFCGILSRFWTRFCRSWDVLLHGNPAVGVFSGIKLARGGELGFGVGEEQWGSGEREVLEDLVRRTEGLVDVVVSRFGEPALATRSGQQKTVHEDEPPPWLGGGHQASVSDGVVFGGIGAVTRPSLRNISLWMADIYTYGEHAYGVKDNPLRERRKHRRRDPPESAELANGGAHSQTSSPESANGDAQKDQKQGDNSAETSQGSEPIDPVPLPERPETPTHDKNVSQDQAVGTDKAAAVPLDRTGIPPPIVSVVHPAPSKTPKKANPGAQSVTNDNLNAGEQPNTGTTMGIPDQYMKYLTLGLSELAKPARPAAPTRTTTSTSKTLQTAKAQSSTKAAKAKPSKLLDDAVPALAHVDPSPDGASLKVQIIEQKRLESQGYFVIGLQGDLNDVSDETEGDLTDDSELGGTRTLLRTLQVEVIPTPNDYVHKDDGDAARPTPLRTYSNRSFGPTTEDEKDYRRLRVLIYVHRPFIYSFLFQKQTGSLQYPHFYKELHRSLLPIHKPLLASTSSANVSARIAASQHHDPPLPDADAQSIRSIRSTNPKASPKRPAGISRPIYDLLYDPRTLTLHSSIPNIPAPGTPAAEGLAANNAGWTRLEALNVHSQVLATLSSVRSGELERSSRTVRGWWVVWMCVPPSLPSTPSAGEQGEGDRDDDEGAVTDEDTTSTLRGSDDDRDPDAPLQVERRRRKSEREMHRTAILVRKSSEATSGSAAGALTAASRAGGTPSAALTSGVFSSLGLTALGLGPAEEKTGGAAAGWGPQALGGGIGVDTRAYVEGLIGLSR